MNNVVWNILIDKAITIRTKARLFLGVLIALR